MADKTEAEAVRELAAAAHTPKKLEPGATLGTVLPEGHTFDITDLEYLLDAPRRKAGRVSLHDAASMVAYIQAHRVVDQTAIYADIDCCQIVCELNGHVEGGEGAGWGDHRAVLTLRKTKNWANWETRDSSWMSQTLFAEHIEENLIDIIEPAAADMLEIAQTFQANNKVAFRSSSLLANGQRQFTYEETIDSKAGQQGTMAVPTEFFLGVAVFDGQAEGHRVRARLQHRIEGQQLKLRYLLERPHDVVRDAFGTVLAEVEVGTTLKAYRGTSR